MSKKVAVRFDMTITVHGFVAWVTPDKAQALLDLFDANNTQPYEDIENLLDLSREWMNIINAAEIEVEELYQVRGPTTPKTPPPAKTTSDPTAETLHVINAAHVKKLIEEDPYQAVPLHPMSEEGSGPTTSEAPAQEKAAPDIVFTEQEERALACAIENEASEGNDTWPLRELLKKLRAVRESVQ